MKRVALLGATGSIGRQTIDIVERNADLELCALAVNTSGEELSHIAKEHNVVHTSLRGDPPLEELVAISNPDVVVNAVVGFAGVSATLTTMELGIDLALANKESLVAAGDLALKALQRGGGKLLPVDSEHSAAMQCLAERSKDTVETLVLTASGGPFRGYTREELERVTVQDALAHPTWSMGPKITTDSATLMNKGLELIEAHYLFGLSYEQLRVAIHPTSIVHAIVQYHDGASIAHMGYPDMRVPISYALTYPNRVETPCKSLNFSDSLTLDFSPPDEDLFPCLGLARSAGIAGGGSPCILNAANEVAVASFLNQSLPFLGIAGVVEQTLSLVDAPAIDDLQQLIELDSQARSIAEEVIKGRNP